MMERERKKGGIKEREDGGREGGDYLRELITRGMAIILGNTVFPWNSLSISAIIITS